MATGTSFSTYAANAAINSFLRNTAYTPAATVYVALYTVAPTDAGGGTEVTGGSYARTAVTFSAPSGGATTNSGAVTFPTATANWGTIVAAGIFDASTSGNLLFWANLTANQTVTTGNTFEFAASDLDLSID